MRKLLTLACVAILTAGMLFFLTACGGGSEQKLDNGSAVSYEGKSLTIKVRENPTTGYSWIFKTDNANFYLVTDKYTPDNEDEELAGGEGTHEYVFEAEKEGTTTFTWTYSQSWEDNPNDESFTFEVTADGEGNITALNML